MAKKQTNNNESNAAVAEPETELFDVTKFVAEEENRRLNDANEDRRAALFAYLRLILKGTLTKSEGIELLDAAETLGITPQGVLDDQRLIVRAREQEKLHSDFEERQTALRDARENWQAFLERTELEAKKLDCLTSYAERQFRVSQLAANDLRLLAERRPELFARTWPPQLKVTE